MLLFIGECLLASNECMEWCGWRLVALYRVQSASLIAVSCLISAGAVRGKHTQMRSDKRQESRSAANTTTPNMSYLDSETGAISRDLHLNAAYLDSQTLFTISEF